MLRKTINEKTGLPVKLCDFPGKHTQHDFKDHPSQDDCAWSCPGVGAVQTCRACSTVNMADATNCTCCTLKL